MELSALTLFILLMLGLVTLVTLLIDVLALMILVRMIERIDDIWRESPENRQATMWMADALKEITKRIERLTDLVDLIGQRVRP